MKEPSCEDVLIAQMAIADGEEPELAKEYFEKHIAGCANCQHELKQMHGLNRVLANQTLSEPRVNLWPSIENGIAKRPRYVIGWQPFALIGLLLVISKLVEMLPTHDLGLALKLVPLAIVVLLFILIRENPFRINTDLVLER